MRALRWLVVIGLALLSMPAPAQVALDQFEPTPLAADGLSLSSPTISLPGAWTLSAMLDYAKTPLSYELGSSIRTRQHVVSDHLVLHVGGGYAPHRRVLLFASLPVHVLMRGERLLIASMEPEGAGIGDVRLGTRVSLLVGRARGGLAAELIARVPTAELARGGQLYSGDSAGSYDGALVGELRVNNVDFRARLGLRARKKVTTENLNLGSAALFAAGARVRITPTWVALIELNGSTFFSSPFGARHTPVELLLGSRSQLGNWSLGVGAGPGLGNGYGTPDFRLLATAGYGSPDVAPAPAKPAPVPSVDADGDGVIADADRCPDAGEDHDGFEDDDGCPDVDDDADGLVDARDACPREAEDVNGVADEDGCPDGDGGLPQASVVCPTEAGKPVPRGCPEPEPAHEDVVQATSDGGEPVEFGRVEYAAGKGSALASSISTLLAVRSILESNPQIRLTRVEGHSDDTGSPEGNERLARRRARAVVRWLVERGIAPERFEIYTCSDRYPREPDPEKKGLQANRRVEFHVLEPASAPHGHEDCVLTPL